MQGAEREDGPGLRTVRTVDGRTFHTTASTATEYLFDPVMVRFLLLSIVIYGLLDNRPDLHIETPPEFFALRFVNLVGIILWACASIAAQNWMLRRGWICEIYTAAVSVPMFLFSDLVGQGFSYLVAPEAWTGFHFNAVFVITEIIVLICFDLLHGHFVAPLHPTVAAANQLISDRSRPAIMPAETPGDQPQPAGDSAPVADAQTAGPSRSIRIGNRVFRMSEIDWIKSEDQYLSVNTSGTRHLLRASLSDVAEEMGFVHGVQVNRSVWVSYDAIEDVAAHGGGRLKVTLADGFTAIVPRARRQIFEHHLTLYRKGPRDE